jgi:hypothetical protein
MAQMTKSKQSRRTNVVANPLFSNIGLLGADPLNLRYRHFLQGIPRATFDAQLRQFWHNAYQYLWSHGQLVTEADLARFESDAYNEIRESGTYNPPFTDAQANALEVFRCVRHLQPYLYDRQPIYNQNGPMHYDPVAFENEDRNADAVLQKSLQDQGIPAFVDSLQQNLKWLLADFGLEVLHLTLAAIKCDFYWKIWPYTRMGLGSSEGPKKQRSPDDLHHVIQSAVNGEKITSAKKLWKTLCFHWSNHQKQRPSNQPHESVKITVLSGAAITVKRINNNEMIWVDSRGKERTISRHRFENRMSKIKKVKPQIPANEVEGDAFFDANVWTPKFLHDELSRWADEVIKNRADRHEKGESANKSRKQKKPNSPPK